MATVSWGAPTLEFIKVTAGTAPSTGEWKSENGYTKIDGGILLQNSSQLETTEGDVKTIKNEKGEDVDKKQLPASYTFKTSVIKKKGETVVETAFNPVNGVVSGEWAMRVIGEDPATPGFVFRKCTISVVKEWSSEQGALDTLNVSGLVPDGSDGEICKDYSATT